MSLPRDAARRYTFWARIGSGVLVLAAGAAAALPLGASLSPGADAPKPVFHDTPGTGPVGPGPQPASPWDGIDTLVLSSKLMDLAPEVRDAPQPQSPAETPDTTAAQADPDPAPTGPTPWRFLGAIVGPRTSHAMIAIDGRQRLVATGDEISGTRIVSIHTDHVVLSDGRAESRLQLAAQTVDWPTTPPPPRTLVRPADEDGNISPFEGMTEAERAQYEQMERERLLRIERLQQNNMPIPEVLNQPVVPRRSNPPPARPGVAKPGDPAGKGQR